MNRALKRWKRGAAELVIVGLGNVGSWLVELIPFLPNLVRVVLVDKDSYESANLKTQNIGPDELGPKALIQARHLRRLNPRLEIESIVDDIANVSLGRLRANLLLGCVDSVAARIALNEVAWRLGMIWLDGGIEPAQRLARVEGYRPGRGSPCFECGLSDADYSELGARFACQANPRGPLPTNGPRALGAAVASVLAAESDKILNGRHAAALLGRQVVWDTEHHVQFVNKLQVNPGCRFNHQTWNLSAVPRLSIGLPLGRTLELARKAAGSEASIAVAGKAFGRALRCPGCGRAQTRVHLIGRLDSRLTCCRQCHRQMMPTALDLLAKLESKLPQTMLARSLRSLGLRAGDILEISGRNGRVLHCEINAGR